MVFFLKLGWIISYELFQRWAILQAFDRHIAFHARVIDLIHSRHAALTQPIKNLVTTQGLPAQIGHKSPSHELKKN